MPDDEMVYSPERWLTDEDGVEAFTMNKTTSKLTPEQQADNEKHAAYVKEHTKAP